MNRQKNLLKLSLFLLGARTGCGKRANTQRPTRSQERLKGLRGGKQTLVSKGDKFRRKLLDDLPKKLRIGLGKQIPEILYHYTDAAGSAQDTGEPQYFVACFSEEDDRLSQWRGYGKSIGGYALGFPFEHLGAIKKRLNDSQVGKTYDALNPLITVDFGPCWYDLEAQKRLLVEAFNDVLRHLETLRVRFTSFGRDPDPIKQLSHPINWLPLLLNAIPRAVSPYFKNPAFKEEREWRLVVRISGPRGQSRHGPVRERTPEDLSMDEVATVSYRTGEYSLIPYVELPVVLNTELTLSRVVVGPTPLPENARAAAMRYLRPILELRHKRISPAAERKIVCEGKDIVSSRVPFRRV
jgi:hypothetical protein